MHPPSPRPHTIPEDEAETCSSAPRRVISLREHCPADFISQTHPPPTASATGLCMGSRGGGEVPPGPHRARSARGRQTTGKGCGLFRRMSMKSLLGKRGRMIKNVRTEKGAPGHRRQSTGASAMPAFCPFLRGCVRVEGKGAAGGTALKAAEMPEKAPSCLWFKGSKKGLGVGGRRQLQMSTF